MSYEGPRTDGNVVRFAELAPTWGTPHAREPGYLRWIVCFYGGRAGFINDNPETGIFSDRTVTGLMWLGAGNRQFGVHQHTITEIYVILKGQVESIEPGRTQLAGPGDCLYMPPGAPHAVRAVGEEDVVLLWCHDENERIGLSQYYDENDERWSAGTPAVKLIPWAELEPRWNPPGSASGGTMRSVVSWAGPAEGEPATDAGVGALSEKISLGCTTLPPGNAHVPHAHPFAEHYFVIEGRAALLGEWPPRLLDRWDYVGFPAGSAHGVRAVGDEPLRLLWFQEEIAAPGKSHYVGQSR